MLAARSLQTGHCMRQVQGKPLQGEGLCCQLRFGSACTGYVQQPQCCRGWITVITDSHPQPLTPCFTHYPCNTGSSHRGDHCRHRHHLQHSWPQAFFCLDQRNRWRLT